MKKLIFTTYAYFCAILLILAAAYLYNWSIDTIMLAMLVAPICLSILLAVSLSWNVEGMFGMALFYFALSIMIFLVSIKVRETIVGGAGVSGGQIVSLVSMHLPILASLAAFAFLIGEMVGEKLYRRWTIVPPTMFCLSYGITIYLTNSQWSWMPCAAGMALSSVFLWCLRFIEYAEPETTGGWSPTTASDPDDYHRNVPPY